MITETPIAFGLTMVVCLALFFYCWYIRKLRHRLTSIQVSATPLEVHEQTGIKKEVVDTFPTVKTYELKVDIKDELQCPICLVEYGDAEILRKLPYCGHVFHIHCVDSWLEKQITCPVCRIVLTEALNPKPETNRQQRLQSAYCRGPSTPNSVTIEVAPDTPSWILVNQPLPLPPAISESTANSNSPESIKLDIDLQPSNNLGLAGESPLLGPPTPGWGAIYLQKSTHPGFSFRSRSEDIAIIESKDCISHASISERWMTESFSFGVSSSDDISTPTGCLDSLDEVAQTLRSSTRQSDNVYRSDGSGKCRSRSISMSWDFGYSSGEEVVESKVASPLHLTISPEHCSFEFLPIVTGPGGDYSLTDVQR